MRRFSSIWKTLASVKAPPVVAYLRRLRSSLTLRLPKIPDLAARIAKATPTIKQTTPKRRTKLKIIVSLLCLLLMVSAILKLLSLPLEERDVWLKAMSGVLLFLNFPVGVWAFISDNKGWLLKPIFVVILGLTTLVGVWALTTGHAVSQTQDAKLASALERAGKANERAGAAYERAEDLESKNLTLRGQVATLETQAVNASKELAGLQKDAADSKAAQQKVEVDLAAQRKSAAILEKEAANAKRDLLELQERLKDRHLTAEQRSQLLEILRANPKGSIDVSCIAGSLEPCNFAGELVEVLKAAGWQVAFTRGFLSLGGTPVGLIIEVKDAKKAPVRAEMLQKALKRVGFPAPGRLQSGINEQAVNLVVGVKP